MLDLVGAHPDVSARPWFAGSHLALTWDRRCAAAAPQPALSTRSTSLAEDSVDMRGQTCGQSPGDDDEHSRQPPATACTRRGRTSCRPTDPKQGARHAFWEARFLCRRRAVHRHYCALGIVKGGATCRTDGITAKVYSGGGAEVDHSSPRPSQGSPANTRLASRSRMLTQSWTNGAVQRGGQNPQSTQPSNIEPWPHYRMENIPCRFGAPSPPHQGHRATWRRDRSRRPSS